MNSSQGIVFTTTSGTQYVYITATNQIITLGSEMNSTVGKPKDSSSVFEMLDEQGIEVGTVPEIIKWPQSFETYLQTIDKKIPSLVLELTQECSLQCEYCVYSGNYINRRKHSQKHMDEKLVYDSIDFYALHSKAMDKARISFYGGEALLQFELIRTAVKYINEVFSNKEISISISSNGTTLSETVARWLNQNENITVTVTLNGYAHDKYRKFPSGEGSLDRIYANLLHIQRNYPDLWDRIHFIANVANLEELLEVRMFYSQNIGKPPLVITGILAEGGNNVINHIIEKQDTERARFEVRNLLFDKQDKYILPYYYNDISDVINRSVGVRSSVCIETASCMPFTEKLFVSAEGNLGICESAGVDSSLGNIYDGINITYVKQLLNETQTIFNTKCRFCWCQRLCNICFNHLRKNDSGSLTLKDSVCRRISDNIKDNLKIVCELSENAPAFLKSFM